MASILNPEKPYIWLFFSILFGIINSLIASEEGKNTITAFIVGFIAWPLGPEAFLCIFIVKSRELSIDRPKIKCPKCNFEGKSVHYFEKNLVEFIAVAIIRLSILYTIFNFNSRACPNCGNHKRLTKI